MKLWKGRFSKEATSSADEFNASILVDQRMVKQDIRGSIAHVEMLGRQGIIPASDAHAIREGLEGILTDVEMGKLSFSKEYEDIHMAVETILTERIGDTGKKLHTARSRNDQVATDLRLYLKEELVEHLDLLERLDQVLAKQMEEHKETVLPGYTHMQRAQPVTLAWHLGAYREMLKRDRDRLADCYGRTDCLPLGACALAGTAYPIDRKWVQQELGFRQLCENTMDAVSDRDFALEFIFCASMVMMHLSRFCEELIYWSSKEFDFVEMDDGYSTGSSIMPQKKNPDMAELIRGKTGRVYGDLMALLTVMKGLPLAYNKDMQEDKEPVFDASDTLRDSLSIFTEMLGTLTYKKEVMREAARTGFMNATDAADYLVRKGVPFRQCHEIIGKMVLDCVQCGKGIEELTLEELKVYSDNFEEDIYGCIALDTLIQEREKINQPNHKEME
ncbi:MAG: argininosuccinate lyase [Dehalobacter sp. 4CP]|nr:argininosuccinate lyase [Dehalobacter sp. 4CP]